MSVSKKDGAFVLRFEKPLVRAHAEEHAAAIAAAIVEVGSGGVLRLEVPFPEGPDAAGLAVLIAGAGESWKKSVELRLSLPEELLEFAEDLCLAKLAVLEPLEVVP